MAVLVSTTFVSCSRGCLVPAIHGSATEVVTVYPTGCCMVPAIHGSATEVVTVYPTGCCMLPAIHDSAPEVVTVSPTCCCMLPTIHGSAPVGQCLAPTVHGSVCSRGERFAIHKSGISAIFSGFYSSLVAVLCFQ